MGVDTKLYINKRWSIEDIRDVISLRYEVKTEINFHQFAPSYVTIQFKIPNGEYERLLHVHTDSEVGGFPAINLNFRSNPEGISILRKLAETFGGIFQEEDTDDDAQIYQAPDQGSIAFILKEALKCDPKNGRDDDRLVEFISNEGWKNNKKFNHD